LEREDFHVPQLAGRIHLGRYVEDQEGLQNMVF